MAAAENYTQQLHSYGSCRKFKQGHPRDRGSKKVPHIHTMFISMRPMYIQELDYCKVLYGACKRSLFLSRAEVLPDFDEDMEYEKPKYINMSGETESDSDYF